MLWRLEQVPLPRAAEQAPFRRSLERNVFEGFCGFSVLGQAIFRDFSAGLSPRAIARKLNQKGIAGPSGKPWRGRVLQAHGLRRGHVPPEDVDDALVQRFLHWLEQRTLCPKPRDVARQTPRLWNVASDQVADWICSSPGRASEKTRERRPRAIARLASVSVCA